ncbi:MAG TPA: toprim domain-containing protein [Candidatus Paceibacterota bacterium]|nr:toprim domain-containing protein [Candidatus Paceibacterota bacterium]
MLPKKIQNFIEAFSKIPTIGPRMARRLAFHLLNLDKQTFKKVKKALNNLEKVDKCPRCFFVKDSSKKLCQICSNKKRNTQKVAIVEKETEVISLEKSGAFKGIYLVIGKSDSKGTLTPTQKLRLKHLKKIVKKSNKKLEEVIIAVNLNTKGDILTQKIKKGLQGITKKITRLGRGIPTGGEIEFADKETLNNALKSRN